MCWVGSGLRVHLSTGDPGLGDCGWVVGVELAVKQHQVRAFAGGEAAALVFLAARER